MVELGVRRRATGAAAATPSGLAWQLFAFLGGMVAYAVHLLVGTALVPFACDIGTILPLTALNLVVIAVAFAALATAWRIWRAGRADAQRTRATADARTAFLGLSGLLLNALAIAIVLFAEAHVWTLNPCLP